MDGIRDLRLLLASRHPLIVARMDDETRRRPSPSCGSCRRRPCSCSTTCVRTSTIPWSCDISRSSPSRSAPGGVFLVATCNDVDTLPPELLRRGRFDEVFFVDLPVPSERAAIIELHLRQRHRDPSLFDLTTLAAASDAFTSAELEAAVVGALYRAFADGREVVTADVLEEIRRTTPLSRTRAETIAALRAWARGRATPASGGVATPPSDDDGRPGYA
jgi:SpoVK/Ycf46/Vps4 family AAA+-type ATPase